MPLAFRLPRLRSLVTPDGTSEIADYVRPGERVLAGDMRAVRGTSVHASRQTSQELDCQAAAVFRSRQAVFSS